METICKENNIPLKWKKHSQQDVESIIDMFNKGLLYSEIAQSLNIPSSTIQSILNRNGLYRKEEFSPEVSEFINNYESLKSTSKMAELYNVERHTIRNFANKNGYIKKHNIVEISREEINYLLSMYEFKSAKLLEK